MRDFQHYPLQIYSRKSTQNNWMRKCFFFRLPFLQIVNQSPCSWLGGHLHPNWWGVPKTCLSTRRKTCCCQWILNAKNTFPKMICTNVEHQVKIVEFHIFNGNQQDAFEHSISYWVSCSLHSPQCSELAK